MERCLIWVLVVGSEQIRIILGECSEDQAVDLFIDGANFIKIGTVINWTPTHVEVRLRTASAYIKQELTAFKTTKAPPALNAGVKYDLQCRSCLAVVAQGLCFGRILEKPQENDVSFFCHGHSGLQSKPRADDLLHDVSIFDIHGVSNVCASCAQQLGTAYQDRTSIWKFAVIWRDISSIPSDTLDLSAAALANFSSILVDACSDLPMCSVILISINDASQPPVPLKLFSAPLFMSATEYPAALPPPRAALGVLMEDQLDKQAVSLPMPQIVLLRGLEELKRNAAFLNLPCLTFVYI